MANLGYIQVTRDCNQECRFCSNPPTDYKLTYKEGKERIDRLMELKYDGVILTGGEATLSRMLFKLVRYCTDNNFHCRLLTNGQKLADMDYLKRLVDAGLRHIGLSIYSCREDVQAFLTKNDDSLKNIIAALENMGRLSNLHVDIQTTINKYNADHLHENIRFLVDNYSFLGHFIWNNLDPTSDRVAENPDTIPMLNDFYLELYLATRILESTNRTFRVERVPLCYMPEFEYASTETRKIVLEEERAVYFLDKKGFIRQKKFGYNKAECCKDCTLNKICAGLCMMDIFYHSYELYTVFVNPNAIIKKIKKIGR